MRTQWHSTVIDEIRNERLTFSEINTSFILLVEQTLPNYTARLARVSEDDVNVARPQSFVDEQKPGIKIQFQRKNQTLKQEWLDSLEELSGGQKTLISLCFVLAVATFRKRGTSVPVKLNPTDLGLYLFDEVDAALDEVHRNLAADLLQSIARDAQILAVSV